MSAQDGAGLAGPAPEPPAPSLPEGLRVDLVDPSAYTPPYDHALATALAGEGARVRLISSDFPYAEIPVPDGYVRERCFYRHARGPAGSRRRLALKLAEHVPDMLAYRRASADADIVHFQWLTVPSLDQHLLPRRPIVLTAHDLLGRETRRGDQAPAQRRISERAAAVIVHSERGRQRLLASADVDPGRVHVIPHGAFRHLAALSPAPLPAELGTGERPVVLFFGLIAPYKGLEVLLEAWRSITAAELWVVGSPRMDIAAARADAPANVRFLPRFVSDAELAAVFSRADLLVAPYTEAERFDQSGVVATALAFGTPMLLSDVGGFAELARAGAARLVPPGDAGALAEALGTLVDRPDARAALAAGAREAARTRFSWEVSARATLAVYAQVLAAGGG